MSGVRTSHAHLRSSLSSSLDVARANTSRQPSGALSRPYMRASGADLHPEAELSISMPRWCMGWDVFCWLGHRRFARHWSVPQLRAELTDTYQIRLSDDAIERYSTVPNDAGARQQDPERLR